MRAILYHVVFTPIDSQYNERPVLKGNECCQNTRHHEHKAISPELGFAQISFTLSSHTHTHIHATKMTEVKDQTIINITRCPINNNTFNCYIMCFLQFVYS